MKLLILLEILDDDIQPTRHKRIRRLPESLCDSIVYEGTGSDLTMWNCKKQYKEVIDRNLSIMKAIQVLTPSDNNFFVASVIETLATHYSIDMEKLRAELPIAAKVVQMALRS